MHKIILARSNSNLATHFCSIVLAAAGLLVIAADANGSAPAANTNNTLTATDIHGARHSCPVNKPPGWLADAVSKSDVESEWGKNHHEHGMGVFHMSVDSKTGKVTHVSTVKSAGFRDLDDAAIATLGRWRWKPGTWKEADVALRFQSGKASVGAPQAGVPNYQSKSTNASHQGMNGGGRY
jgi:TonB family protein